MNNLTLETFLHDIKNNITIFILLDKENEIYHAKFKNPETNNQYFTITITPNRLFYTGDMGTYTFGRNNTNMLYFFGNSENINIDYWAEKCLAYDTQCGFKEFDKDIYIDDLLKTLEEYEYSDEELEEIKESARYCDNDISDNITNVIETFNYYSKDNQIDFELYPDFTHYSYHFIWCLYAINYGCKEIIKLL